MMLASRADSSYLAGSDSDSSSADSFSATTASSDNSPSSIKPLVTATLLVTNLPAALFSKPSDMDPLLRPFGSIQAMQILSSKSDSNFISVVVEYKTLDEAQEAKAFLQGQVYAGFSLELEYIQAGVPLERSTCGRTSFSISGNNKRSSPLNPLAAPFVTESQNDLSTPSSNFNSNPNTFRPHASELKYYHQVNALPPGLPAAAQTQYHGPYQQQRQYSTHAIPTHSFSYPGAPCVKTPGDRFSSGFMANSASPVCVDLSLCVSGVIDAYTPLQMDSTVPP
jgi:hypothetical protein